MSGDLSIEQAWVIQCGRCDTEDNWRAPRAKALALFAEDGWRNGHDGQPRCPACQERTGGFAVPGGR